MTNEQFNEWLIWYFQCWPDAGAWYRGLPADARAELGRQWFKILGRFERRDLIAACYSQLSGDADVAPAYQRSLIAAHLREAAAEIAAARRAKETSYNYSDAKRDYERPDILKSSWACVVEINQRVKAGEDREAVTREIVDAVKRCER